MDHEKKRRVKLSLLFSVPIAFLGGLIGLGGAEFRLPVLAGPLGYSARKAIPINLAVSLVTLIASLVMRSGVLSLSALGNYVPEILSIMIASIFFAYFGAGLAHKLNEDHLETIILVLLVGIGLLLIVESFLPDHIQALLPAGLILHIATGLIFGIIIGSVSSILGIAGGELIIPTLIIVFGVDVKTAGTASLLISLPTVIVGLTRYYRIGSFRDREQITDTIAPMGLGSIVGAIIGGILVPFTPAALIKFILGIILNVSAIRIFWKNRSKNTANV